MRILFATGQGGGHFGPLVPFARAYERAGHEVMVAAPHSAAAMVERAGFAFRGVGEPHGRSAAWAPVFSGDGPGAPFVVRELFVGLDARAALPGMVAAVEDWRPDLIVRETCEFASCVAAEQFDLPVIDVGPHLNASIDASGLLAALAAEALDEFGPHALRRPRPLLTCSPRSLDDGDSDVQRFRIPGAGERIDTSLVYVSFGSEIRSAALFRETAEALAEVPKRVLMTLGYHVDPSQLGALPPNVHVERWVNQAEVMPHAAAMVGHGGSGGTLNALAAGVPIAFLPLFVDGPSNASRVAELGAGIVASSASQVAELLADPTYREAAERVADEIRGLPPVEHAVDVLSRSC
jgi:UDP:flavonoid glycosyltransferase YjiC (YdhE family)